MLNNRVMISSQCRILDRGLIHRLLDSRTRVKDYKNTCIKYSSWKAVCHEAANMKDEIVNMKDDDLIFHCSWICACSHKILEFVGVGLHNARLCCNCPEYEYFVLESKFKIAPQ